MMTTVLQTRTTCRVCGSPLTKVLDLGHQVIAGGFGDGAVKRKVPLVLMRCDPSKSEDACGLVQLEHTTPPSILYSSYWYRSGVNQTMTKNLHGIAAECAQLVDSVTEDDLVIDVGCNDGTLLDGYLGIPERIGYEPCDMARYAEAKGHTVVRDFFSYRTLRRQAKIITSIAMFYDLDDPAGFVRDVADSLHQDGIWCLELHYLPAMLETNGFDAICHEHLCYYSLAVIERLLMEQGLEVVRARRNGINGGSIRVFASHKGSRAVTAEDSAGLRALRVAEFELELDGPRPYAEFADRVNTVRHKLHLECSTLKHIGKRIHVYGASTKGNVILQYANLGPDLIECAADRNPDKAGTFTATGIPVVSEDESRARNPDYYLMLPWHFVDEFVEREQAFLERGGRFLSPLPTVRVIG